MRIAPVLCDPAKPPVQRWRSGLASLDSALGGGIAYGRIHEIYAAEVADAPSAMSFGAMMASGMARAADAGRAMLWLRTRRAVGMAGVLQANGWSDLGGAPEYGLLAVVPDIMALLRAAIDALRCQALGAVIMEAWGPAHELDLTASRRLALAAEKSGVPLFLLRSDAAPVPSAAQTRWQAASAPSHALPGRAPGQPVFDITLLRQRSGPAGLTWQVEWDRDQRKFREASLSGAMVSVSVDGPVADRRRRAAWSDGQSGNRDAA